MQWKPVLAAACIACVPLGVAAEPTTGDFLFTLSGSGSSDSEFDNNSANVSFALGQWLTNETVVGIRQSAGAADIGDDSAWNGATRLFADYHFDAGPVMPYVGANFGGVYGDGVDETFFAGPEAGLKYFIKEETFVDVSAEYQVFFDNSDDLEGRFDDGAFVYSAGIGILF